MNYDVLASVYDLLVKDDQATERWVQFTRRWCPGRRVLELACGSGEISIALARAGWQVEATDVSPAMIAAAAAKPHPDTVSFHVMDMRAMEDGVWDGILCYCDSINYLENLDQLQQVAAQAAQRLNRGGVLLFDMHTQARLQEFAEEFIEEGYLDQMPYQWTILSDEDRIYQHFAFWSQQGLKEEHHVQTVFDPLQVRAVLENNGFAVEILTDFDQPGIHPGEKLFYVGRKR